MSNVKLSVNGEKLIIEVDLSQELGASSSGKNILIGSTGGNVTVPGKPGIKVGLNVYKPSSSH